MITYRLGAILVVGVAAAIAMLTPTEAADKWVASKSLANGVPRNCGDPPFSDYAIEVLDNILIATPTNPSRRDLPFRLDLKSLQPNGSGRISFMPPSGIGPVQFDLEPCPY